MKLYGKRKEEEYPIGIYSMIFTKDKNGNKIIHNIVHMDYDSDLQTAVPLTDDEQMRLNLGFTLDIPTETETFILYKKSMNEKLHGMIKKTTFSEND